MLDVFHLPTNTGVGDVQIFTNPQTVTNLQWKTWIKPRGKTMAYIMCIGGGAGGGGGNTAASGVAAAGGGGGGSSAMSKLLIPLRFLPDILYIQVGAGGIGAPSNPVPGTGDSGILSYVGIYPDITATNILAISGAAGPVGGQTGSTPTNGGGGAAGTVPVIGSMPLAGLGHFTLIAGQTGTAGAATAGGPPGNQNPPTTGLICMGGTGGGGHTGSQIQAGGIMVWPLNVAGDGPGSLLGNQSNQVFSEEGTGCGSYLPKPFFSFAGIGGKGRDGVNAVALSSGDGGPGSGGGGGGCGSNPGGGGKGGNGGTGFIAIVCW